MKTPITLKVLDITGSNLCVSSEDGRAVFQKIKTALEAGHSVDLDFAGIDMVISAFLNAALGKLVEIYDLKEIKEKVLYSHLEEADLELVDRVLKNAELYYQDPERFRKALEIEDDDDQ